MASSLWSSDEDDHIKGMLEPLTSNGSKKSRVSGLFDSDSADDNDSNGILNPTFSNPSSKVKHGSKEYFKELYEQEHKRRLELESEVESLTSQISILHSLLSEANNRDGGEVNIEENEDGNDLISLEERQESRRLHQLSRQKRCARAGNRRSNMRSSKPVAMASEDDSVSILQLQETEQNVFQKQETNEDEGDEKTDEQIGAQEDNLDEVKSAAQAIDAQEDNLDEVMSDARAMEEEARLERQRQRLRRVNRRRTQRTRQQGGGSRTASPALTTTSELPIPPLHQSSNTEATRTSISSSSSGWSSSSSSSCDEDSCSEEVCVVSEVSAEDIEKRVLLWCRGKDLLAMIQTLPQLNTQHLSLPGINESQLSNPQHVRKAYLKIARHCHPDKQRGRAEDRLLNEKIFSALADAYQQYKSQYNI